MKKSFTIVYTFVLLYLAEGVKQTNHPEDQTENVQSNITGYNVYTLEYSHSVCEGDELDMYCPLNYQITVTRADWGRDTSDYCSAGLTASQQAVRCQLSDVTTTAKIACDGRTYCNIPTSVQVLGNTCSQYTKRYLHIVFECKIPVYNVLACVSAGPVVLECPSGQTLEVKSATYGEDDKAACRNSVTTNRRCNHNDARLIYHIIKKLCDDTQRCEINPSKTVVGDSCSAGFKYLQIEYSCVECRNLQPEGSCEYWTKMGECTSNSKWMYPYCRKSCTRCDHKEPACENHMYTDSECNQMVNENKCWEEPDKMFTYCRKACGLCDPNSHVCKDEKETTVCENLADNGKCSKDPWTMTRECLKSCSNCKVDDTTACQNLYNENDCHGWAESGECYRNPAFMIPYCRRACTNCRSSLHLSGTNNFIGNPARPGHVEPSTARYTIILPYQFNQNARLTYFLAFFAAKHSVALQIWRPTGHKHYFDLHYSLDVKPMQRNSAETITFDQCVAVSRGDRIGFTSKYGTSPIAAYFKQEPELKVASRKAENEARFNEISYPYIFSIGAGFDTGHLC